MPRLAIIVFLVLVLLAFSQPRHQGDSLILNGQKINLEIARTPTEMARGLSGRASLPADSGMLFVYQEDVMPAFWMKEMRFNLDIIWLDKNWQIVGLEKNISPQTYPQTFSPPKPIRYVLEVNAGLGV